MERNLIEKVQICNSTHFAGFLLESQNILKPASMIQREWRGAVGTAGLGYWTHDPDGSLPLAQLECPIPWASPQRATSIHKYIHEPLAPSPFFYIYISWFWFLLLLLLSFSCISLGIHPPMWSAWLLTWEDPPFHASLWQSAPVQRCTSERGPWDALCARLVRLCRMNGKQRIHIQP